MNFKYLKLWNGWPELGSQIFFFYVKSRKRSYFSRCVHHSMKKRYFKAKIAKTKATMQQ